MRKAFYILATLVPIAVVIIAVSLGFTNARGARASAAATCLPTDFMRDSMFLTAAMIATPGTFTGTVNASGCNIGIYYKGITVTVNNSEIYGANYSE